MSEIILEKSKVHCQNNKKANEIFIGETDENDKIVCLLWLRE